MASTAPELHAAALRISILHILRATGFHSTRPSVLDSLVNITERYLLLLASTTASHALANHNSTTPTLTDVRCAMTECGALLPSSTTIEESWIERLRPSAGDYDALAFGSTRRERDARHADDVDTADVRAFTEWVQGDRNKEIARIAGLDGQDASRVAGPGGGVAGREDFLTALKRRNKLAVEEERWAGTVLGRDAEDRQLTIEGGDAGSVDEWSKRLREKTATAKKKDGDGAPG